MKFKTLTAALAVKYLSPIAITLAMSWPGGTAAHAEPNKATYELSKECGASAAQLYAKLHPDSQNG
jgi:hypothetical protein